MANNLIQIKRTSISGRAANTTTLPNPGELALNMTDGILYSGNGSVVFEIGANNTNVNVSGNLTVKSIIANSSVGTAGQVLTSNGSSVYWKNTGSSNELTNGSYTLSLDSQGVVNIPISLYSSGQVFVPNFYSLYLGTSSRFIQIDGGDGTVKPNYDGQADLGASGLKWKDLYLSGTAYINKISANGSVGSAGQVLTSNGTAAYWSTEVGYTGSKGDIGYTGSKGDQGTTGFTGSEGIQGNIGYTGSEGPQGTTGFTGSQGIQGNEGFTGSQGGTGFTGSQGNEGFTGSQGIIGYTGSTGFTGSQGNDGYTGSTGFVGSQGPQGTFGGAAFEYYFSANTDNSDPGNGELKFSNTNLSQATHLYISENAANFQSVYNFLQTIDDSTSSIKGHFTVTEKANTDNFVLYSITGNHTHYTYYFDVPVSYLSGSTSFSNALDVIITFARTGDIGDTGYTGSQGIQGYAGSVGFTGSIGFTGSQGNIGYTGSQGDQGTTGFVGSQGGTGYTGSKGDQGIQGYTGSVGFTGSQGNLGYTGSIGYTGSKGDLGYTGSVGFTGSQGNLGYTGSQGIQGYTGSKGDLGYTGSTGDIGYTGSYGFTGSIGIGYVGSKGDLGYTGSAGGIGQTGYQGSVGFQGSAGIAGASTTSIRQAFTGNGSNTQFTIVGGYNAGQLDIFLNGVKLNQSEVDTSSGTTFTITSAPPTGTVIEALSTFGSFDSSLYVNTSYNYTLTGNIAFRGITNATTLSVNTFISVGNSTVNTYITPGNVYLNGSTLVIGNTASNVTINSVSISIGTSSINTSSFSGTANNASNLGGVAAANYVQNTDSRTLSGNLTLSGLTTRTYSGGADASLIFSGRNDKGGGGVGAYYNDFMRAASGSSANGVWFRTNFTGDLQLIRSDYGASILNITQGGIFEVGGGNAASANSQSDATTNYIKLNNNNSQIYDDGNFHIHSRGAGQSMWINTNNGQIIIGSQAVGGGSRASAITMGSSTTATAYLSVYGSKTYSIGSYGYLAVSGAGTGASTTASYSIYSDNRMNATEFDATSDERAKNIQGTIPLDTAVNFVKNVDGIHYTWNSDAIESGDTGLKAGFGAQSIHKAGFDHMIGAVPNEKMKEQTDDDGWKHPEGYQLTVGYNQAIPYHHEVIKYLLNKIEKLEEDIKILKETK